MKIRQEIIDYIEKKIFPIYETFDKGHDVNHITAVIKRSFELYEFLNDDSLNLEIIYVVAALHDIGMIVERKNHPLHSQEFVLNSKELKEWFNEKEIKIIGEAVADHSTSSLIDPRSIYGKIISDADKDDVVEVSLYRAYEFAQKYYPNFTKEECIENVYEQLVLKYGENSKVKFWINSNKQEEFKKKMNEYVNNKELFIQKIIEILN